MRYVSIDDESHPDVLCFIDLLSAHFGTRKDALAAFVRSSPVFRDWRKRVAYCQHCERHVPIKKCGRPEEVPYNAYDYHRAPNPDKPPPYSVRCPGAHRRINQGPDRRIAKQTLNQWLAHIKHRIKQVQSDLL